MDRAETILAVILTGVLIAGVAVENWRGAPRDAEVVIAHTGVTPFDATPSANAAADSITRSTPAPGASPWPETHTLDESLALRFLNASSPAQLKTLPGVGDVLAQRIAAYRDENGPFNSLAQLLNVNGIGAAKLEDIELYLKRLSIAPTITPVRAAPMMSAPAPRPTPFAVNSSRKLSLNLATRDQLMSVSGIGESLADQILRERARLNGFRSWKQIDALPGIGESRLMLLRRNFTLPEDERR